MRVDYQRLDRYLLVLLMALLFGLPWAVQAYDRSVWQARIPEQAKVFTLTGNAEQGWILGDVHAYQVAFGERRPPAFNKPVIHVAKGDRIVFKLKSSDVLHGFSLKDFGIYLAEGIPPGKVRLVSFVADKVGTFTFSCNAICGRNHETMQGTLVVSA